MAEIKFYTLEEISKNNGTDGSRVWIIYKDSVYDVSDYLEEHPGGGDLITEWAGKDCTKAFDEFGHSGDAKKDLKKYKIGELAEEDRKKKKDHKKKVATAKVVEVSEKENRRSCCSYVTCGLFG